MKFTIKFAFNSDEGYIVQNSKPIEAETEEEACILLKDQFECFEGVVCDIISVSNVTDIPL
jgi:hypothetical protein